MAPPFREFASYIVRDLAVRTRTMDGNITFSGNHSSPQYGFSKRGQNETEQQFTARVKEFRRMLPRGSDSNLRLALAMEACMRAGDKSTAAAAQVLEYLRQAAIDTEKRRRQLEKLGIPYKRIEFRIGATRRGSGYTSDERQAETIRTGASRFKREFERFETRFEAEFGTFRFWYHRDAEWLAEAEPAQRKLIVRCEQEIGQNHSITAGHTLTLARMLHEQGRFEDAEMEYQRALDRWRSVSDAPADDRDFVVSSIIDDVTKCKNRETRPLVSSPDVLQ